MSINIGDVGVEWSVHRGSAVQSVAILRTGYPYGLFDFVSKTHFLRNSPLFFELKAAAVEAAVSSLLQPLHYSGGIVALE